jgi:hypothetical protein
VGVFLFKAAAAAMGYHQHALVIDLDGIHNYFSNLRIKTLHIYRYKLFLVLQYLP